MAMSVLGSKLSALLRSEHRAQSPLIASCVVLTLGVFSYIWLRTSFYGPRRSTGHDATADPEATDPPLLKKFSTKKSYHVPATGYTYSLRIFYREHSQASKLPTKPAPLPLLVFIHGLGGQAAQFAPLLTSLINVGPCLAIDLPGCGLSDLAPKDWAAYTTLALAELVSVVVRDHLEPKTDQGVILIAHSMGCSLAALLASSHSSAKGTLFDKTLAIIPICPRGKPLSLKEKKAAEKILAIPSPVFALLRVLDRRGGLESASVKRMVGEDADAETKRLQLRYNLQSRTETWRRMAYGFMRDAHKDGTSCGMPAPSIWSGIKASIFLVAGEHDTLTLASEVEELASVVRESWGTLRGPEADEERLSTTEHSETHADDLDHGAVQHVQNRALKIAVLPRATHGLLYAPESSRILSGLIQGFLSKHVDKRLGLGWQLQHLSTEGKWDVKNLEKWKKIQAVSEPIGGIFRAMKTMREVDDVHSPAVFAREYNDQIWVVCDISHESPVYDPKNLEAGGIRYVKFPTVSKLPPTEDEVGAFNQMIDRLRRERKEEAPESQALIAVHCHYGFNRTGFFLVCYLVEREGWQLQDALHEFANWRSPGIKHAYFVDALFARYCAGMRRRSTIAFD